MNTHHPWNRALTIVTLLVLAGIACGLGSTSSPSPATSAPATSAPATSVSTKGERGTPDEAKAMLQLAVEHYQAVGRDQALADFNAGADPFIDRDLYVVCLSHDGIETANGGFPQYVGSSADALRDADGNPLGQALVNAAAGQEIGSVEYRWVNPVSGKTEPKITYVKDLGQDVCGVGAYNPPG